MTSDNHEAREAWADQVGPALSRKQVAGMPQAVEQRAELLTLTQDDGQVVYPAFQFDGGSPVPGVGDVVRVLAPAVATTWTIAAWFTSPKDDLDGRTPIETLRHGDVDLVVSLADRFASELAGPAAEQARRNAALREAYVDTHRVVGATEIAGLLVRDGRVFSVDLHGEQLFPAFQFDLGTGDVLPQITAALAALPDGLIGWELAAWFDTSMLNKASGEFVVPLDVLDEPERLVRLARATADRWRANGAGDVPADRTDFVLDEDQADAWEPITTAPPRDVPRLRRLMSRRTPFALADDRLRETQSDALMHLLSEEHARRVTADPALIEQAKQRLVAGTAQTEYRDQWLAVLAGGVEVTVAVLTSRDDLVQPLKSDSPFAGMGLVSPERRAELVEAVYGGAP